MVLEGATSNTVVVFVLGIFDFYSDCPWSYCALIDLMGHGALLQKQEFSLSWPHAYLFI